MDDIKFSETNMRQADLKMNSIGGAEFINVDLSGANLGGAILDECKLEHVNLTSADFTRASIKSLIMEDVNLRHANLTGIKCDNSTIEQIAVGSANGDVNLEGAILSDELKARIASK